MQSNRQSTVEGKTSTTSSRGADVHGDFSAAAKDALLAEKHLQDVESQFVADGETAELDKKTFLK